METVITSPTKTVVFGREHPTVIVGEKINPTGRKKLSEAIKAGDVEMIKREAILQVEAGAQVLDVNCGVFGIDEAEALVGALQAVSSVVDVPLCIDSSNPDAIAAALRVYKGKALVNSTTGEDEKLEQVLPLVKQYGAAVIGLAHDDKGISNDPAVRVAAARKIVEAAESYGIPRSDIIIDCIALTVGVDQNAPSVTLETIRRVVAELDLNITLGVSNVSFGLPRRAVVTAPFLTLAIGAGLTCAIIDPTNVLTRETVLATDLLLGKDQYAMSYISYTRALQKRERELAAQAS